MKSGKEIVFGDKTLSSLLEDIYTTTNQNRLLITTAINDLRKRISSTNTTNEDVSYVGRVIADLFDTTVKNDEHLLKLATVVQKLILTEKRVGDDERVLLTEQEKQQLLSSAKEEMKKIKDDAEKQNSSITAIRKELLVEETVN